MGNPRVPYQDSRNSATTTQPKRFATRPELVAYSRQVKQDRLDELEELRADCTDPDLLAIMALVEQTIQGVTVHFPRKRGSQ